MAHGKNAAKRHRKYRKYRDESFFCWFCKRLSHKLERYKGRRLERMTLEEHESI